MRTKDPLHKLNKKEAFWQHHIDCWSQTTLTQTSYCRSNNLSQSDFSKWKKKLNPTAKPNKRRNILYRKDIGGNYRTLLKLYAGRCGFCLRSSKHISKIYHGTNEFIAICDNCVWHLSNELFRDNLAYKELRLKQCIICHKKKSVVGWTEKNIGICQRCLSESWHRYFSENPSNHPCQRTCVSCQKTNAKHYLKMGAHILCADCVSFLIRRYANMPQDKPKCGFCGSFETSSKKLFGIGNHWICHQCSERISNTFESDQPTISISCDFCGTDKNPDIKFVVTDSARICNNCVKSSYELLFSKR